ncbi:uncharacterized protein F4817DRAFT_312421 [Daldinia loculata]|uniref:uncharacterized protein n=1 Tax=Daldinia loculata TaxID=103429 RepID=UPI0020C311DE|nr:uncharacterized protein F4817DRAFT_312421 [Daldinia loculata]KAI1651068.1 hypothetical protein F4817DRAFT_312421 [Daldinia loculata]
MSILKDAITKLHTEASFMELASELGLRDPLACEETAIVEGTPVARWLYEKCSLRANIEEMRFDVGDEFAGRRKPKLIFMTREPRK